jgi:hypothetical protein
VGRGGGVVGIHGGTWTWAVRKTKGGGPREGDRFDIEI